MILFRLLVSFMALFSVFLFSSSLPSTFYRDTSLSFLLWVLLKTRSLSSPRLRSHSSISFCWKGGHLLLIDYEKFFNYSIGKLMSLKCHSFCSFHALSEKVDMMVMVDGVDTLNKIVCMYIIHISIHLDILYIGLYGSIHIPTQALFI